MLLATPTEPMAWASWTPSTWPCRLMSHLVVADRRPLEIANRRFSGCGEKHRFHECHAPIFQ